MMNLDLNYIKHITVETGFVIIEQLPVVGVPTQIVSRANTAHQLESQRENLKAVNINMSQLQHSVYGMEKLLGQMFQQFGMLGQRGTSAAELMLLFDQCQQEPGQLFLGEAILRSSPHHDKFHRHPEAFGHPVSANDSLNPEHYYFLTDPGKLLAVEPDHLAKLINSNRSPIPFNLYRHGNQFWALSQTLPTQGDYPFDEILAPIVLPKFSTARRQRFPWEGKLPPVSPEIAKWISTSNDLSSNIAMLKEGTHQQLLGSAIEELRKAQAEKDESNKHITEFEIDALSKRNIIRKVKQNPESSIVALHHAFPHIPLEQLNAFVAACKHWMAMEHAVTLLTAKFNQAKENRLHEFDARLQKTQRLLLEAEITDIRTVLLVALGVEPMARYPNDELNILLPVFKARGYSLSQADLLNQIDKYRADCTDEASWKSTDVNNATSLEDYLKRHPDGRHATDARHRLKKIYEHADWMTASKSNTREDYKWYLRNHPDSAHAPTARKRIKRDQSLDSIGRVSVIMALSVISLIILYVCYPLFPAILQGMMNFLTIIGVVIIVIVIIIMLALLT